MNSKLQLEGGRVSIPAEKVLAILSQRLCAAGCTQETAHQVAEHLVDASLCGVESHGLMRVIQYIEQYNSGYMQAEARPGFRQLASGSYEVDGNNGIGIPAMILALKKPAS